MTHAFGFTISNITLNISGPSVPVDTSDSLVICANNILISNAPLASKNFCSDCLSSHSLPVSVLSTFISPKPGSIESISFGPVGKFQQNETFFFAFFIFLR